ncbi:MAG: HDIG domain-containing protein [Paraprevotella sp.]|nr:HDIG domain-containing protein [Paraprevotella sp.]
MSRYNQQRKISGKALIYRFLITAIAVVTICLYMPRDDRFHYTFDIDKPWRHGQLIATHDFPIYKSEYTIQKEQDSILRYYKPYFVFNKSIGDQQIARFRNDFNTQFAQFAPTRYLSIIEQQLKSIYSHGVMGAEDYNRMQNDSIGFIRIISQNEAKEENFSDVFSQKTAYELLASQKNDTTTLYKNILRKCNINEYITPNLTFDTKKSENAKNDLLSTISYASGIVMSGQKIIDRGDIVDEMTYQILLSLEREYSKSDKSSFYDYTTLLGKLLYVSIIAICLVLYFVMFRRDYLAETRRILFLASLPVIFPILTSFLIKHSLFSVYIIPYAMAPIFIRVFMDSRTAFVTHVSTILICAATLKYPYEFIATQLVSGMIAIYSLRELSQRSQLIRSALFITLAAITTYAGIELIQGTDITRMNWGMYIYITINGIMLLFAYPLLFLLEKMFGFTSNVTLVELSNINNEPLRMMSEVAPGTFQHSMQVANLATEVANKIGAKSQLVRTGALYHDIGKTYHPVYFTENQTRINPHERLTNEQSASVVISHVKEGLKLAEKHRLPQVIKDFITTHHGLGKTKYFLISYQNEHPDEEIDESLFTYPGPNPFTLEQAILMMADSVEAASRSLNEYTAESISNLVDKIINSQVEDGFFNNCPITFQDISTAKEVFKEKLKKF